MMAVGCIGWLVNTGRPDIAYAHSRVAQHMASPTTSAMDAVKRIMAYLKGAKDWCLGVPLTSPNGGVSTGSDSMGVVSSLTDTKATHMPSHSKGSSTYKTESHLICEAARKDPWQFFCDSDFAGNTEGQNRMRSQNGFIATCDGAPVLYGSKVSSVAFAHPDIGESHADVSSGANEIYAAGNATHECLHLSYIADEAGIDFPKPIPLQMDNSTAESFAKNNAKKTKLKHIDARQEWVKVLRDKSILVPVHVPTKLNLADMFTGPLRKKKHFRGTGQGAIIACSQAISDSDLRGGAMASTHLVGPLLNRMKALEPWALW